MHSRTKWSLATAEGLVKVDGQVETKPGFKVGKGQTIEYVEPRNREIHDLSPAEIQLDIVYEDEAIIVVNKPRGLATHPSASLKEPSLVNALLARGSQLSQGAEPFRPGIVHRLDKETTGLIVVAKSDAVHAALAKQFESREARRIYIGLVAGDVERDRFEIDAPIGRDPKSRQRMAAVLNGKPALTQCAVLDRRRGSTLMAFKLKTGRTHQIRVHLRAIGHPILGDSVYATREYREGPLMLHAAYLQLVHPTSGARVSLAAQPPPEFELEGLLDIEKLVARFQDGFSAGFP